MPRSLGSTVPPGVLAAAAAAVAWAALALAAAWAGADEVARWPWLPPRLVEAALDSPRFTRLGLAAAGAAWLLLGAGLLRRLAAARTAATAASACIVVVAVAAAGHHPAWAPVAWLAAAGLAGLWAGRARAWAWRPLGAPGRRARAARHRWTATQVGMAAVGAGVALRVAAVLLMRVRDDGGHYAAMGHAWAETGRFLLPWGELLDAGVAPSYSHHYPPGWPVVLGVGYRLLGFGAWQTQAVSLAVSLAALLVVFLCTRDLYGRAAGWLVTGVLAVEPHLVWSTGTAFSENLVLALWTGTLWAILRSLDRPPFILLGGALAAALYLTRSSMGAFFLVAGAGGFLWRFLHRRWGVLRDGWYLAGGVLFAAAVAAWGTRNARLFGAPRWDPPWQAGWTQGLGASALVLVAAAALGWTALCLWGRPRDAGSAASDPVTLDALAPPSAAPASRRRRYVAACVAAGAVLCAAVAWLAGNAAAHGVPSWQTSRYIGAAIEHAAGHPGAWAASLAYKLPWFLLLLLPYAALLHAPLRRALRDWREEHAGALWLAAGLVLGIGWLMASALWTVEDRALFWTDNRRYVLMAFLPLLWLAVRPRPGAAGAEGAAGATDAAPAPTSSTPASLPTPATTPAPRPVQRGVRVPTADVDAGLRLRAVALVAILLGVSALTLAAPVRGPEHEAAAALAGRLEPGDTVAVAGRPAARYTLYAQLGDAGALVARAGAAEAPDYVLELGDGTHDGHRRLGSWEVRYLTGTVRTASLWERCDGPC